MTQKEVINKLDDITSNYNFIYVIAAIVLKDFCSPMADISNKNFHEQLNYNELGFIVGLWVKNCTPKRSEIDIHETYKKVNTLMEYLHQSLLKEGPKLPQKKEEFTDFLINGSRFKEAFFYSSTGGYDYQFVDMALRKYQYDQEWIKSNKGFQLITLKKYFSHIRACLQKRLNDPTRRKLAAQSKENMLELVCLSLEEINDGNQEYKQITNSFTIELFQESVKELNEVGDYNEFLTKPIIKVSHNKYFIPLPFFLAEAMYESPYYWMRQDDKYINTGLENRGKAAETIVYEMISKVFGSNNTYRGIDIKQNSTKTITDIDVIATHEDVGLIIQIKSKKLTALSKKGNIEFIKSDFQKAIESAYEQGLVCKDCIENHEKYIFDKNNPEIKNHLSKIKTIYIICLVLDAYPAITHLTNSILYSKYEGSTIALTVLDLDLITHFLITPKKFIDYISKRINNCRFYLSENEGCFLGFYIKKDLKKIDNFHYAMIENDYGGFIDQLYYPRLVNKEINSLPITKMGRNDLCNCNSGLKFKRCCGKNR